MSPKNFEKSCMQCLKIKLKKILGLTVCSSAGLDVSSTTGVLAYPAGCTVVLFNSKKLSQNFLLNTAKKAITAVAYSECGRYLATGECGHNPSIKVWELDTSGGTGGGTIENGAAGSIVAEFSGHKYAVSCVAFSPTGKYLVSVGSQHDNIVNVFDWKANLKIASNKVTAKVVAVSFSEDGNYFVTVGNRHVKYWYLEGSRKYKEPIPLMGRSAILGELRNNDFCAVACGKGEMSESTYAITRNGHLVEFNARRLLDKWVMCRTNAANCMVASTKYILVGCAEAIVRVFNAETLEYITTLPRTHFLGVDVAQGVHINHMMAVPQNAKYPDTIAIVYDETRSKVTCVYNDHSLYIWDLRDIRRVGKSQSFLYHSACIWGVETVPFSYQQLKHNANGGDTLPSDCFMTCSSDDTIRVWDVDSCETNEVYRKNIYSKELLKVLYIDDELNFIKDTDNPIHSTEKNSSYDGRNGVRCIKISPDSRQLATGDRSGNIRIYNLSNLKLITTIEAHDSEVLCLEYTNEKIDRRLLASASRDRLIHIFDCEANYRILQTLDDHSSSITSVRFIGAGKQFQMVSCGADKSIIFRHFQNNVFLRGNNCSGKNTLYDMEVDSNSKHILTACQDRNIRVYSTQNAKHTKTFKGSHSDEGSLIKVSLDLSGIYIATSCTDKTLSVYDYYSNECMARMYGHSELVTGLKFTNDCKYLISASGDGCVFIWQVPHDMIVTMQARLSQQALRSGIQPIPRTLQPTNPFTDAILNHPQPTPVPNNPALSVSEFGSPPNSAFLVDDAPVTPGYRFSDVGQLPQWAKRKPSEDLQSSSPVLGSSPSQGGSNFGGLAPKPRGRWGQKGVGGQLEDPFDLRNIVESSPLSTTFTTEQRQPTTPTPPQPVSGHPTHPPATNTPTSGYNSSGSKDVYSNAYLSEDSSIDSGRENRRPDLSSFLHKKITETKALNSLNSESNTEHDGDVEDISDGERTSSDHGMVYYPSAAPSTPTDFKINDVDTNELRKSIRRQKLEKQGLSLAAQFQSAASGTGTGTSDDEDEGSTPSGDNADRSLASTLGGSSESIPQQASSTFLQAVLDGPGSLSDRERSQARKSMSAKHNNDAKITTSISKSFANNKKEELMKVINEAKAKLENVGYRSGLRASQSISDLSHSMNMSGASPNRTQRIDSNLSSRMYPPVSGATGPCGGSATYMNTSNFLHSAATRSKLAHNCMLMNQIQQELPPYPRDVGIYEQSAQRPNKLDLIELPPVPADKLRKHPGILKNYKSCPVSPVHEEQEWSSPSNHDDSSHNQQKSHDRSGRHGQMRHSMYYEDAKTILSMIHSDTEKMIREITSKYGDLDDIQPTTKIKEGEKPAPPAPPKETETKAITSHDQHEHGFLSEDEPNFSSDSLEDCSLDLDLERHGQPMPPARKKHCAKHNPAKKIQPSLPKRSVSDYFIYDQPPQGAPHESPYRNVSLSDILDDEEAIRQAEHRFLETQRHSSASFFLGQQYPTRKSQESILSDEFGSGGVSFCNSMESILSDDSECKSAPLEVLFGRIRRDHLSQHGHAGGGSVRNASNFEYKLEGIGCATSKSYGSSPNAGSGFDYYMQGNYFHAAATDSSYFGMVNDSLEYSGHDRRATVRQGVPGMPTSLSYPRFLPSLASAVTAPLSTGREELLFNETFEDAEDFIPSLTSKAAQYGGATVKSLSKDFANQRKQMNSNPLYNCNDGSAGNGELFIRKTLNATNQHHQITRSEIFGTESSVYVMKKSCSFEIEMGGRRIARNSKKFEQNLQRFEQERKQSNDRFLQQQFGGTLEMDYVPHKPPVAHRRSASMKGRGRVRSKEKFNTIIGQMSNSTGQCDEPAMIGGKLRDFVNRDFVMPPKSGDILSISAGGAHRSDIGEEKTFEVYVAEKGVSEDDNMDSLELLSKAKSSACVRKENSTDSLEVSVPPVEGVTEIGVEAFEEMEPTEEDEAIPADEALIAEEALELPKKSLTQGATSELERLIDRGLLTSGEYNRFLDIEKKIDIINKLVELEERKLEQERTSKEYRMRPFDCDPRQKGYVKSLTENFDRLAKDAQEELENEKSWHLAKARMKRNFSLPDVLDFGADCCCRQHGKCCEKEGEDCGCCGNGCNAYKQKDEEELSEKDENSMAAAVAAVAAAVAAIGMSSSDEGYKSPNQSTTGSGQYKPSVSNRNTSTPTRNTPKRSTSSVGKGGASLSAGMGVRSVSVGMLNQASDSEAEPANSRGGLLKPTISSQNKINGTGNGTGNGSGGKYINPRSAAGIINRRKGLQNAYINISTAGQDESSSEESPTSTVSTVPAKPAVPPRPRSIAFEHKRIANVNTSLINVKKTVTVGGTTTIPSESTNGSTGGNNNATNNGAIMSMKDADLDNADLTNQLCTNIINQLVQTTSTVIQLHQRLKSSDEASINGRNNSLMLKELENAVIMTQNMLTKVTNRNHNDGINNNNSMSNNTNNQIMYEKCVDMLNQVQKHVNNNG
uniref:MABP1/WDR62 second WD40 domain-containing protein n=1 Tax=Anopheles culicifacies TaxID=139723 RepID=A0A182MBP5_9DIPT